MSVWEKLLVIQSTLKAPKNQRNTFGNYNYRSCEDILEALKPILAGVKAIVTLTDKVEMIGTRYYITSTATLLDVETGESTSASAYAREADTKKGADESQITGSASSYARKYALNGLFAIDDTKDADYTNNGRESPNKPYARGKAQEPQAQPKEPEQYICASCGRPFEAFEYKGKQYSARDAYMNAQRISPDGKARCSVCRKKREESKEETK